MMDRLEDLTYEQLEMLLHIVDKLPEDAIRVFESWAGGWSSLNAPAATIKNWYQYYESRSHENH